MAVLLTRRAIVQAAMEASYGDPAVFGLNDGVLVSEPMYSVDPNLLTRDFTRDTLSQQSHIIGRKLAKMTFTTELRGNGKQKSGALADAPIIARLFRACGYKLTASASPSLIGPFDVGAHDTLVAWTPDVSAADNTDAVAYYVTVTTAGPSGTAEVTITSDTVGEGEDAQVITSGTELMIGTHGLGMTPVFDGDLAVGQHWIVWLMPAGLKLKPVSNDFESITLGMNKDGVYHLMPGAFGTFEIEAEAGAYAKIKWTFTGTWRQPVDVPFVSPVYEKTLPSQVELARLRVDDFNAIVNKFTFNQVNDIQIRPDVSSAEGYIGTRIVSRKPEGGIDPEADTVARYDFWGRFGKATRMPLQMRVGTVPGNTVWLLAPNVQYSGMTYQDRNGILTYDAGLKFAGYQADDEFQIFLM